MASCKKTFKIDKHDRLRHADPGLQPERTALAWNRTNISLAIVALFFLRWVPYYGIYAVLLSAFAWLVAVHGSVRPVKRYQEHSSGISSGEVKAQTIAVGMLCVAVFGLGFFAACRTASELVESF